MSLFITTSRVSFRITYLRHILISKQEQKRLSFRKQYTKNTIEKPKTMTKQF